jgi:hypothetical protein
LAHQLAARGYRVELYDPYFHNHPAALAQTYDFIMMTEVAEHLFEPGFELERLRRLIKPGGALGIMTALYHSEVDFTSWYYRRDPTHVCFFSEQSILWIQKNLSFSSATITDQRVIWLQT